MPMVALDGAAVTMSSFAETMQSSFSTYLICCLLLLH